MKFFKGKLCLLGLLHTLAISFNSPLYAVGNEKFNFEASLFSEAEWNLDDRAAWMNEAAFYTVWKPVSPFFLELGTLHTYGLGDDVVIDDLQGFSNIKNENMAAGLRMLDLGFENTFGADSSHHLVFLSGVRNVNEDYFTEGNSTLFLNGSDGIFPTIAANYEMANFPLSGVCPIHVSYSHKVGLKAQFSLYNGIAGELADGSTFRFRPHRDGVTTMTEIGYSRTDVPLLRLYSVGLATNNSPAASDGKKKFRATWWTQLEQGLLNKNGCRLNLLLHGSTSLNSSSNCNGYAGAGLVLNRSGSGKKVRVESVGLMNHYACFSDTDECNQELTLQMSLFDLFTVKPSFQLVEGGGSVQKVFVLRLCYELE
ncbi:MAG: hypothetical protein J5875_09270 [Paludibacteraceae bacterium]|nr:hypothetical protein [Paludibacteraceae bacterium]